MGPSTDPSTNYWPKGPPPSETIYNNRAVELVFDHTDKNGNEVYRAKIPVVDPEVKPGNTVYIRVYIEYADGKTELFGIDDNKKPWQYEIKEYVVQKESENTISLNNKFDPTKDEEYTLIYKLSRRSFVDISIYNLRGEVVKVLKHDVEDIGKHVVKWNGKNDNDRLVSMGLYLVNVQTVEYGDIRKVIVIIR